MSNVGTSLKDIKYNANGTIKSLSEYLNGAWVSWRYLYDSRGNFLYRYRNIGKVDSDLSSDVIPGTNYEYYVVPSGVDNCIGFTVRYEVTKAKSGEGFGDRNLYIYDGSTWTLYTSFTYDSYGAVRTDVRYDSPTKLMGFATPMVRTAPSGMVAQSHLENVLTADYFYVAPA